MLAAPAPLMSTDGNVRTRRSRRGGRRCHARRSSPEAHSAARWPALVQGALRQERASKRTGILQSWMRLQAARAKIRRFLWRYWTLRVVTLDTIHEITEGRACPDHPFSHPLGFEVLAPLSLRDRWIFLRANRLAFHVPVPRALRVATSSTGSASPSAAARTGCTKIASSSGSMRMGAGAGTTRTVRRTVRTTTPTAPTIRGRGEGWARGFFPRPMNRSL